MTTIFNSLFKPDDAYVAAIDTDGDVFIAADLADPAIVPVAVVEFFLDETLYRGVYHEAKDVWEIFRDRQQCYVAPTKTASYDYCEKTVTKFKDKLLAGPCPDNITRRLAAAMVKDLLEEMDSRIIHDINIASGKTPPPMPSKSSGQIIKGPPTFKISTGPGKEENSILAKVRSVIVKSLIYQTTKLATND